MELLTLEKLKAMKPYSVFATGTVENSLEGIFTTRDGGLLRWVAVRGGIWDWAIYIHWADKSITWIKNHGDKVIGEANIRKLVPCDDEAFKMYRY